MNPAAQQAIDFLQQTNWPVLLHSFLALAVSMAVAALVAPAAQAVLEGLIASFLPGWAFFAKPLLPTVFSYAVSSLVASSGKVPGFNLVVGTAALASGMHWVNNQPWAADLEAKFPKVWDLLKKIAPDSAGVAKMLLVGFLLSGLAVQARAVSFAQLLSPSAEGPATLELSPLISAAVFDVTKGVVLTQSTSNYLGGQFTLEKGPYGIGITGGVQRDANTGFMCGAAGGVLQFRPWGEAFLVWSITGCKGGITVPLPGALQLQ